MDDRVESINTAEFHEITVLFLLDFRSRPITSSDRQTQPIAFKMRPRSRLSASKNVNNPFAVTPIRNVFRDGKQSKATIKYYA